ncbi:MAG TPA: TolC family protein [Chthoniobacteraceae bacterium]|nr:TolC family protein [Chthoniobacteraceae bacterium]
MSRFFKAAALAVLIAFVAGNARAGAPAGPIHNITGKLTLDEAVKIALKQNPNILKALQQIEVTRGQIIEVRAEALPHITLAGDYSQEQHTLLEGGGFSSQGQSATSAQAFNGQQLAGLIQQNIPSATQPQAQTTGQAIANTIQQNLASASQAQAGAVTTPNDKSWRVTVQATQVLYAGGQVAAAIRIAKFAEDSSYFSLRDIVDQTIATVREQFYNVLLTRALIKVQEESVKLLEDQLKDQQNRFEAGTVPRFNVLQAEVALANQQPQLISARNNYLIAQYQIAKSLNLDPGPQGTTTFNAVGELEVHERPLGLKSAIQLGIERRPFLKVQRLTILIQKEQIKVALAGYKPQLNANGGYEVRSSSLSHELDDTVEGWFFGITGSWNIFDGLATYGKVKSARANLESAKVNYDDSVHQIELEVQQAYANLQTARETIRSQEKTVEQAREAVRLATERLAAGAGTQLDVLNAQVQLTTARSTVVQARANYNSTLAEFDRVTATDTVYAETFDDPLVRGRIPKAIPVEKKR